jgi:hypothetical protein
MANNPELNSDLASVLETALHLVTSDRAEQHGDAIAQHQLAAAFWTVYLEGRGMLLAGPIRGHDIAQMMLLLKVSRGVLGSFNPDTFVDQAGYAALSFAVQKAEHSDAN